MDNKLPLKILYVEDESKLRERICIVLRMRFDQVFDAANGSEGLEAFLRERPDIVVSDIKMPVMDGLEMTMRILEISPETPVILSTAFTETTYLLRAIELGVAAYIRKPLDCRQLIETIARTATPIIQRIELEQARQSEHASLELLLGNSPAMQEVIHKSRRIATTDFSIIIQGETGVGKSHLASIIHGLGPRKHRPFIPVTMGALPESIAESQLFGHIKGAFTNAVATNKGLFEEAQGGTIFLDDVDCAPHSIQAKILNAVEQKRFFPVGATKQVEVDIRIIAASNRDLMEEVQKGNFREDLYYRLSDLVIVLPPLRARGDDIAAMARMFLHEVSLEMDRIPPRLTPESLLVLNRSPWPGNLRELKSVMKRVAMFAGEIVTGDELSGVMTALRKTSPDMDTKGLQTLDELKCQAVRQALAATGGKKMEAARLLDVDYSSFKRMLEKYNI